MLFIEMHFKYRVTDRLKVRIEGAMSCCVSTRQSRFQSRKYEESFHYEKGVNSSREHKILFIYTPIFRTTKYIKQNLNELKKRNSKMHYHRWRF